MGWASILLLLVALQAITLSLPKRATADDVCNGKDCGQGTCKPSDSMFGYVCECKPNWSHFHIGNHLRFLPCIIPECSINYSCSNESSAPAPSPPPNFPIFDPCHWSYCGGGTCVKTSTFHHRCECNDGYFNLLNVSSLPCIKNCSLGIDCAEKGILTNASFPSLSQFPTGSSSDSFVPSSLIWFFASMFCLLML
ncbi:slit homolog 2 protein-like [Phoenix dactylifera]|uniref:Slit homolog 2 protein-like n=1 Tax=Phoenix dactylifera TaxID=42345 RepID=A0A8B9ANL1_PHODC|nr:slit homolog 2 protein-like [Phoenix dactylifera]